jgi:NADH dehydrogenase [ubiquinone] 1 alpha subcomplex assembly factor 7
MRQHLSNLIKNIGPISVADFMNEVLFNPIHGYYNHQNPFGKNGDFITAPEISQVFGELIGAYFISLWQNNYSKQKINLVEMGAGRGTLMRDLLGFAKKIPNFEEVFNINIIEISPRLQDIQKENLRNYKINWWKNFSDFYEKNNQQPIFFIANELFDCMAVNQFVKTEKGWQEKVVTIGPDNKLHFALSDYNKIIDNKICELVKVENITEDAVFEYSNAAQNLMMEISKAIKKTNGIGLIIDYGYVKNEFKNTLQAVKNHQYCDVLKNAGDADLTALVNFSQLENIAKNNQLNTSIITQKNFLESLEIELRREKLTFGKTASEQKEINSAIDRLTDPKQMGELFKCLIFWC